MFNNEPTNRVYKNNTFKSSPNLLSRFESIVKTNKSLINNQKLEKKEKKKIKLRKKKKNI